MMREEHDVRTGAQDHPAAPQTAADSYEPPAIEDLDTSEGPSVTAAGPPLSTPAAPRDL
jgi:hypothetical protein